MGAFDNDIPVWAANHIVTDAESAAIMALLSASHLDGGLVNDRTLLKATAQTFSTQTTLQSDSVFQFPLQANASYSIDAYIPYTTNTTALFKCAFAIPSGASGTWEADGLGSAVTVSAGVIDRGVTNLTTTRTLGSNGGGTAMKPRGSVTTVAAGTLIFQYAQAVSNAVSTGVTGGAWMSVKRIG